MTKQVARLGDTSTHGGTITSASSVAFADGRGIARNGDTFFCPIHQTRTLIANQSTMMVDGRPAITVGASVSCGAIITTGSPVSEAG
jgi:uncharacterized Zn-binding protein involved in type VI secretion